MPRVRFFGAAPPMVNPRVGHPPPMFENRIFLGAKPRAQITPTRDPARIFRHWAIAGCAPAGAVAISSCATTQNLQTNMETTMKSLKAAPTALGFVFAAATALIAQDAAVDADGDGMVTMEEFALAYPDLTEESFTTADLNADGMLDADELAAAAEAGVLPAVES